MAGAIERAPKTWRKPAMSFNTLHTAVRPEPREIWPLPLPTGTAVSDKEDKTTHQAPRRQAAAGR